MATAVRVRYAPSPTGQPHIGNIRTALFNWLFARRNGGKFIVRIEDTDQTRLTPGAVEAILDGLRWLNIDWDEGPEVGGPHSPYEQSRRLEVYRRMAEQLVDQGNAYYCYCSREELERLRRASRGAGAAPYSGGGCNCRRMGRAGAVGEPEGDDSRVVRFAMPESGVTQVRDLIRGDVEWRNELQEDFIILKSDGFPTYHLAVVADDHLMEISHVMRAEEWLPSTPRHLQLYSALGFQPPEFAHLPMITGTDRAKLSKRHGATAIGEYREQGYLPEALLNFMVLLGWSLDGSTEVMPLQTIIDHFTIDRITKSAAIFDQDKLLWMNGVYIRELDANELARRMTPFIPRELDGDEQDYLGRIAPLVQERLKRLDESGEVTAYFFGELPDYDPATLAQRGMDAIDALIALQLALDVINRDTKDGNFDHKRVESSLKSAEQRLELSRRQFFGLLRVAATGRAVSPPLFETMEVLGRKRVLFRLSQAIELLLHQQSYLEKSYLALPEMLNHLNRSTAPAILAMSKCLRPETDKAILLMAERLRARTESAIRKFVKHLTLERGNVTEIQRILELIPKKDDALIKEVAWRLDGGHYQAVLNWLEQLRLEDPEFRYSNRAGENDTNRHFGG